jgi:PKD repeat protein
MKALLYYTIFSFILILNSVFAQDLSSTDYIIVPGKNTPFPNEQCATDYLDRHLQKTDPAYKAARDAVNSRVRATVQQSKTSRSGGGGVNRGTVYTIPIVVHIMHEGEAVGSGTNISDAQIFSCIDALIRDFRRNGNDLGIAQSGPLGMDSEIEFCFAKKDPLGNPTSGITRHDMSGDQGYLDSGVYHNAGTWRSDASMKAMVQWDPLNYMNVWVVNKIKNLKKAHDVGYTGGVQGYATFPTGGSNPKDGAVMLYSCTGNDPDGTKGYNLWNATNDNRVFTHEIGHYLNLYHTFQGASCAAETDCNIEGDECCDTPPTTVGTGNNCLSPQCSGAENKENYMQYQNGNCAADFTPDQVGRMRALFAPAGDRENLVNNTNCLSPFPINPYVKFIQHPADSSCTNNITGIAQVCNGGTNTLTSFDIIYDIDGLAPQTLNWSGNLGVGDCDTITFNMIVTTNGIHNYNVRIDSTNINGSVPDNYAGDNAKTNPFYSINGSGLNVSIKTDCKADDISWEVVDSLGNVILASQAYDPGIRTIFEEACLDTGCFFFKIYDNGGDGMRKTGFCPSDGTYTITDLTTGLPVATIGPNPNFGDSAIHGFCLPFNPSITPGYSGCDTIYPGATITFTDLSIGTPNIIAWEWDFGDGSPVSNLQNPTHSYAAVGNYNVKLKVTNAAISDSITKTNCVVVEPTPAGYCDTLKNYGDTELILAYTLTGGWGFYPGHNSAFLEGYAEPFNLVTPSNSIQKVILPVIRADFGSPTSKFVLNVYGNNAGQPGVILSSDTVLISSLVAGISNEVSIGSPPNVTGDFWVGFEIDYTNSDTLAIGTASHRASGPSTTYVKTGSTWNLATNIVSLNSSMAIKVVYTDAPVLGTYTVSDNSICAGQSVTFDASGVSNYDSLTWYFPGGTPATSTNTTQGVTYLTAGSYDAILYLESICSNDSVRKIITVDAITPSVSFTESALSICEQDTVRFNASATIGNNLTTLWSFQGGSPTTSINSIQTVLFTSGGAKNIKFVAKNGCGADSVTKVLTVNAFPTTSISPIDTTVCNGNSVTLNATGGAAFTWNTGANTTAINEFPTTTTVYWATSNSGVCLGDTVYTNINVNPVPTVIANATPDSVCLGALVSFTMNGSNAIYYGWNFGDANTSNSPNTTHLYGSIGNYTATLTGTYGVCDNTGQVVVKVVTCTGGVGVDENILDNLIHVYPNPANNVINVDARNAQLDELKIEIINNTGQIVYIENSNNISNNIIAIDLDKYAKGLYMIKFSSGAISAAKRLVILK